MRSGRGTSLTAVLAGAALVLGACGSGADTAESEPEESTSAEESSSAEASQSAQGGGGGPYTEEQLVAVLEQITYEGESMIHVEGGIGQDADIDIEIEPESCTGAYDSSVMLDDEESTVVIGAAGLGTMGIVGDADPALQESSTTYNADCREVTAKGAGVEIATTFTETDQQVEGADDSLVVETSVGEGETAITAYQAVATIGTGMVVVVSEGVDASAELAAETAAQAVALLRGQ